jgi:serine/threonine-protein kinase
MSPEQLRSSHDVDRRTDIWSLGVILFELVSGHPPFTAQSVTELAIRVWMDPRPPFVGPMPNGFDQVIDRCLAKKPDDRYPDLANLAHALAAYAGSDGWDLANSISRLLRAGPIVASGAGDPGMGSVDATVPPTAFADQLRADPRVMASVPTTLGSSAASLVARPTSTARRWGLPLGIGVLAIAIGAAVAIVHGGGTVEPRGVAEPHVAVAADAAVRADAAVALAAPADAAEPAIVVDAEPELATAPIDAPAKKKLNKKTPTSTEDYGESRY